jgi:hypothetical protein
MRTMAAIARRLTCLTLGLALALLAATAMPAAAQLQPYHSVAYTEGNLLGFGPGEHDNFGYALASGDFNGDGADDLVTGVPDDDNLSAQEERSGIAIVRYGVPGVGLKGGIANTVLTQIWGGSPDPAEVGDHMGTGFAVGDFDGDGFDDVAVGILDDEDDDNDVGGVQVYYGAAAGIQLAGAQFFNQYSDGFPGGDHVYDDNFSRGLAAGDFDGDGFADLAIGQPVYTSDYDVYTGRVMVIYGSVHGLDDDRTQTWTQDHVGMDGSCENDDHFGWALAAGDFDGDGRDDLAIGVPGENDGGGFQLMYGGSAGLSALDNNLWTQDDSPAVADEAGDLLGASLAVGDFDHDGFDDIAVGAHGEGVDYPGGGTAAHAGAVLVFFGAADRPSDPTVWTWTSTLTGLGSSEPGDHWGAALTTGDFDNDGFDDLAVGAWNESIGAIDYTGEVTILRGYAGGITSHRGQVFNQGTLGVPDTNEAGDGFGYALAAGDFDGNGHDDLVAGVPSESTAFYYDGAVTSLYGFVFADDFESNSTGRWQLTNRSLLRNTNGIGASTAAKLGTSGQYGLSISLLDVASNPVYVMAGPNQGFAANTTLRGSFWIDVQHLTMSPAAGVNVFRMMSFEDSAPAGSKPRLTFDLHRNDALGGWAVVVSSWNDAAGSGGSLQFAGGVAFAAVGDPNGHNVRLDFEWSAGNPGHLRLWKTRYIGGAPDGAGTVLILDLGLPGAGTAVVNALYMGMVSGKDPGTYGQLYLDELQLSR